MHISQRWAWIVIAISGLIFIIAQSYIAQPRPLSELALDSLLPIIVIADIVLLLISFSHRPLLYGGIIFALLTLCTLVSPIIAKPYGTFFFLFAVYQFSDWYNYKRFGRNLMTELQKESSILALGIIASTFILGLITEFVNLPFMIWSYNIPLPSLDVIGIPSLIAAFGWTPWTLAILSIFYHFVLLDRQQEAQTVSSHHHK